MYEVFVKLLKLQGVRVSDVSRATGIASSTFTDWKKGRTKPKPDKLQKIADYFNVSIEYLLTGEDASVSEEDDELREYLEELRQRPEMRMLFSVSKGATKSDIEKTVKIIEALKEQSEQGGI